ncbi:3-hydroxybenzoate 6-monooxygenase [soil metagenome]
MSRKPILIVGGGIGGLAASLAVALNGRNAIVFEQAPVFSEVGAGLQVGPNAVRALKMLGAWDAVAPQAFAPPAIEVRDGVTGRLLQHLDLGDAFERRFGESYRVIHRADLLRGLLETAQAQSAIALRTGTRIESFEAAAPGIIAGGEPGAALIGADGLHSAIRRALLQDGPPAAFPNTHYRALIERGAGRDAVCLWLYPGGHVVHYPVSAGEKLNIVATIAESVTAEGWSAPAPDEHVRDFFAQAAPALSDILLAPRSWTQWQSATRPPAPLWSKGVATLLGDAAHPALPYLAQGAAMALEDAAALGLALRPQSSLADAFKDYETARHTRTARVASASQRLAKFYHARGVSRHLRNAALGAMPPARFLDRMAWIYEYDPSRH